MKIVFGPDELDGKRARARSRLSDDQWYLQGIRQPWELYLFTPLPVPVQAENTDHGREAFLGSLQQIIPFSQKIGSPFTETFLLSKFILSNTLPGGHFDEAHESNIVAALQQNGFSQYALETFRNTFSYIKDFHRLQWPAESILGLCALSLSNVFGGMGSWNDMDPGEDGEVYQRVSADLFEAIRKYFAELISVP